MEDVGAQRIDRIDIGSRERPQRAGHDRRDSEPAPQPEPRQSECRRGDDGEIDVERPVVRLVGRNQHRRDIGADEAEPGERRPVQERGRERQQCDQPEQDESDGRRQEAVEPVSGIDRRVGDGGAGGGEDARDVRSRQPAKARQLLRPPRPFAGGDQRQRQQPAEEYPHRGPDQALVDRIAHQIDAAERKRDAADPDHPTRAEAFLEADPRRRRRRGRRARNGRHRCGGRRGRRCSLRRLGLRRLLRLQHLFERRRLGRQRDGRRHRSRRPGCCQICQPYSELVEAYGLLARQVAGLNGDHQRHDGEDRECQQRQHRNRYERIEHGSPRRPVGSAML